jgi:glycosyltransferase involved in cell wall biosynthesis
MPRLLHIMNYVPRGARTMDHYVLAQARELRARGWEARYAFAGDPPQEMGRELTDARAEYVVIRFPFDATSSAELIAKLAGWTPDVVLSSFLSAFTRPLLDLKRRGFARRLVVIDHSSGETPPRRGWRRWAARLRGWWVGRRVDAVLPVSAAIARRDIERVFLPVHKVKVVYNGIRLDLFPNPPRPPREKARVVYAGQLIPEKGVMSLLRAHARLRDEGVAGYDLLIAGAGPQEQELKAFCDQRRLSDVKFLGHVDDMPAFFGSADVVVVPSEWYEAFGLVVAEAMACGAACLVSDAGALPEVVGVAGRVFRAGNDADLASQLKTLTADPEERRRIGRLARLRVEEQFGLERMVAGHVDACEAMCRPEVFRGTVASEVVDA